MIMSQLDPWEAQKASAQKVPSIIIIVMFFAIILTRKKASVMVNICDY